MPDQGPTRDSPQGFAYSLRDFRTARAGQIPSLGNLGVVGAALKGIGKIFKSFGDYSKLIGRSIWQRFARCSLG